MCLMKLSAIKLMLTYFDVVEHISVLSLCRRRRRRGQNACFTYPYMYIYVQSIQIHKKIQIMHILNNARQHALKTFQLKCIDIGEIVTRRRISDANMTNIYVRFHIHLW